MIAHTITCILGLMPAGHKVWILHAMYASLLHVECFGPGTCQSSATYVIRLAANL